MNFKYAQLKALSQHIEPKREHKYGHWKWLTGVKTEISIENLDSQHLNNIIRITNTSTWKDIYAGHTREEWLKALKAERHFRNDKAVWLRGQSKIRKLRRKNNK